jgi:hypothetical protein
LLIVNTNQEINAKKRDLSENFVECGSLLAYKSFVRAHRSVLACKATSHMLIRCPKCNRTGNIPDRFGLAPHKIRCRACEMRFLTIPLRTKDGIDRPDLPIEEFPATRILSALAPPSTLPVVVDPDDDDDSTLDTLGPGDSHYELTVVCDDEDDDSQDELSAYTSGEWSSSDEIAALAENLPSDEILIADPRYSNLDDPGGLYRLAVVLTVGALTLAIVGFFARRGVLSIPTIGTSIMALIAGCVGLGGLGLLLLAMTRSSPRHRQSNDHGFDLPKS